MTLQDRIEIAWNFFVSYFDMLSLLLAREFPAVAEISDIIAFILLIFGAWIIRFTCLCLSEITSGPLKIFFIFVAYTIGLPGAIAGVLLAWTRWANSNAGYQQGGIGFQTSQVGAAPSLRPDGYNMYEARIMMRSGDLTTVRVYAENSYMASKLIEDDHGVGSVVNGPFQKN